jgi:catechol 2,3-dioxygenase-like lactoylglutathione lyase family enzyme
MITRLAVCTVCVSDQDKARAFYTEKLGFEVRRDDPMGPNARWLEVAPKGGEASIVLFTPPGMEGRIGTSHALVFDCDDPEATYRELSSRGVVFKEKPTRQPWGGIHAQFEDQDGNTFVLVNRPKS